MNKETCLLTEMEDAADELGLSVSTLGRLVGQGGRFYSRLKAGKRSWPETEERVRAAIQAERSRRATSFQTPEDAA